MTLSIKDAEDCLAQLRAAVDQLRTALEARGKLEELGKQADRKGNKLREEMGRQLDPIEWNRLHSELPEEQQIARIHATVRDANARVLEVRKQLHTLLDSLRSRKTAELFGALDSVPWDARDGSTGRYIGLAESIIASGRSTQSKRAGSRNKELAVLKGRVCRLYLEFGRPRYRDFCGRLDAAQVRLPNSPKWGRSATWAIAFEKAEGAVSRWFSGVVNSEH